MPLAKSSVPYNHMRVVLHYHFSIRLILLIGQPEICPMRLKIALSRNILDLNIIMVY